MYARNLMLEGQNSRGFSLPVTQKMPTMDVTSQVKEHLCKKKYRELTETSGIRPSADVEK